MTTTYNAVCDCGNWISYRDMGEGATVCEWCEYPECPIYAETGWGLSQCFQTDWNEHYNIGGVSVWAQSKESAILIAMDYKERNA